MNTANDSRESELTTRAREVLAGLSESERVELLRLASRDGMLGDRRFVKMRARLRTLGLAWDTRPGRGRSGHVSWYIDETLGREVVRLIAEGDPILGHMEHVEHPITFAWHDGTSHGSCISCNRALDLDKLKLIPITTVSVHFFTSENSMMTVRFCRKCLSRALAVLKLAVTTAPKSKTSKKILRSR